MIVKALEWIWECTATMAAEEERKLPTAKASTCSVQIQAKIGNKTSAFLDRFERHFPTSTGEKLRKGTRRARAPRISVLELTGPNRAGGGPIPFYSRMGRPEPRALQLKRSALGGPSPSGTWNSHANTRTNDKARQCLCTLHTGFIRVLPPWCF